MSVRGVRGRVDGRSRPADLGDGGRRASTSRSPRTVPTACASSAWRARRPRPTTLPLRLPWDAGGPSAPPGRRPRRRRRGRRRPRASRSRTPDLCPRYVGAVADVRVGPSPGLDGRPARPRPASARSTTSSTSPTTCCSSSASRCTRSTSSAWRAGELRVRRARAGETHRDARRRGPRTLDAEMLVIADAARAAGRRRRDGRRGVRGLERHAPIVARERVLQAGVRAPHEQAARPEDRSVVALRARRRHRRPGRGARARAARCSSRSAPAAARGDVVDCLSGAARTRRRSAAPARPDRRPARHGRRATPTWLRILDGLGFDVAPTPGRLGRHRPDARAWTSRARWT